jgi:hypothetical protein
MRFSMHDGKTALETLQLLWRNYCTLSEKVDLEMMTPETLEVQRKSLVRPLRIAAWLARQGFFISAWSLWEFYSLILCKSLSKVVERGRESFVNWVGESLAANKIEFLEQEWFSSASSLRNLIAHNGARVDGPRAEKLMQRSKTVFADLEIYPDLYIDIQNEHVAELMLKIEDFIRGTCRA